mgnify:CR=1 FL=1
MFCSLDFGERLDSQVDPGLAASAPTLIETTATDGADKGRAVSPALKPSEVKEPFQSRKQKQKPTTFSTTFEVD